MVGRPEPFQTRRAFEMAERIRIASELPCYLVASIPFEHTLRHYKEPLSTPIRASLTGSAS